MYNLFFFRFWTNSNRRGRFSRTTSRQRRKRRHWKRTRVQPILRQLHRRAISYSTAPNYEKWTTATRTTIKSWAITTTNNKAFRKIRWWIFKDRMDRFLRVTDSDSCRRNARRTTFTSVWWIKRWPATSTAYCRLCSWRRNFETLYTSKLFLNLINFNYIFSFSAGNTRVRKKNKANRFRINCRNYSFFYKRASVSKRR